MRIGILTFHFGNNYGGILQCYALQQVLKARGHNAEVLNYRNSVPTTLTRIKNKIKQVTSIKELYENTKSFFSKSTSASPTELKEILRTFDDFRSNYLNISPELTEATIGKYVNDHFDAIIVGSDQVWTSLYDAVPVYFFGWKPNFQGKKYSYAACSAHKDVSLRRKKELRELLSHFDKITVRDATTASLVSAISGKSPEIVPDPTELYSFEEFACKKDTNEPYILTYILGDEIKGGHSEALQRIKKATGLSRIYAIIIPNNSRDIEVYAEKRFLNLSPEKWVEMFSAASFVYTDSFHAIMFSLKFGIPFIAYYRNSVRSSRLIDLKNSRGVKNIVASAFSVPKEIVVQRESIKTYEWSEL